MACHHDCGIDTVYLLGMHELPRLFVLGTGLLLASIVYRLHNKNGASYPPEWLRLANILIVEQTIELVLIY
jgi:hypothetical protein